MSVLACIISHSQSPSGNTSQPDAFGSRALKPAIDKYPQFLEMLVTRLSSADHALCTSALQLINSLMRDAISEDSEVEWPKFIKRLQDLGVIRAVYNLMQSTALIDLASPLLEFQGLTKVLLRKWREAKIDLEKPEHRRALKGIHLASNPPKSEDTENGAKRGHSPEKWRRLGFKTESPAFEFDAVGFLGMMDLADYVRKNEGGFQKLLLEQSTQPFEERCPIALASLSVTYVLYEHFEIDKSDLEDSKGYFAFDSRSSIDKTFKPMILQWSKLHTSCLQAFMRLWNATGAEKADLSKIVELIRILIEAVVGGATRTKDVKELEEELRDFDYERLRELQMELLELTYEDVWGQHLRQVRDGLDHEALQFIKEQRIRCLLQGAWFPMNSGLKDQAVSGPLTTNELKRVQTPSWRFARLSHNRRWLHWRDFVVQGEVEPSLDDLPEKSKSHPTPFQPFPVPRGKTHYLPKPTQSTSQPSPPSSPTSPPPPPQPRIPTPTARPRRPRPCAKSPRCTPTRPTPKSQSTHTRPPLPFPRTITTPTNTISTSTRIPARPIPAKKSRS